MHGYAWCPVLNLNVSACDSECGSATMDVRKEKKAQNLIIAYMDARRLALSL